MSFASLSEIGLSRNPLISWGQSNIHCV